MVFNVLSTVNFKKRYIWNLQLGTSCPNLFYLQIYLCTSIWKFSKSTQRFRQLSQIELSIRIKSISSLVPSIPFLIHFRKLTKLTNTPHCIYVHNSYTELRSRRGVDIHFSRLTVRGGVHCDGTTTSLAQWPRPANSSLFMR